MKAADLLSISRVPLAVLIALSAINGLLVIAFIVILIAIATDILDGEVARRSSPDGTELGKILENVGDFSFSVGMIAGLFFTHHLALVTIVIMAITFFPFVIIEFRCGEKTVLKKIGTAGTPFYYIATVAILLLRYALLAFGEYAIIVAVCEVIAIIILGRIKRRRLIGWLHGKA